MSRLPCLVLSLTLVAAGAGAATFTVTRTTDAVDPSPGDGICGGPLGPCSLRQAVQEANSLHGADTILLPEGAYLLTLLGEDEDGDGDGAAACDIGVVEAADLAFVATFESGDTSFWSATTP